MEVSIFHEFMLYVIFYDWQGKYRFLMSYSHCKLYYNIFIYAILKNIFQAIYWAWISLLTYYYTYTLFGNPFEYDAGYKTESYFKTPKFTFLAICRWKSVPFKFSHIYTFPNLHFPTINVFLFSSFKALKSWFYYYYIRETKNPFAFKKTPF